MIYEVTSINIKGKFFMNKRIKFLSFMVIVVLSLWLILVITRNINVNNLGVQENAIIAYEEPMTSFS